jgi:acetyl esterase
MNKALQYLLITLLVFSSCQAEKPAKYVPKSERKREKYATPEPGTYLKPVAHAILNEVNRIIDDPETYREPADWMMRMLSAPQKRILDTLLPGVEDKIPVRIYYPTRQSLKGKHPVTLFFHGGGFVLGSVDEYHVMVSKLARITGQIIISVEYRLAPEHPFPAGLEDCYAVLRWTREYGTLIGADTTRISVMGDSAGGNLATVVTLRCRDEGIPQPASQILIYPGVSFVDTIYPSRNYFIQQSDMRYMLDEHFLRSVKEQYMGGMTNDRHPYLSPLEAELSPELAPALVITAECDPIRDGGRLYARELENAGVEVEHLEYSGMIHGFMSFHMILGDALDAMKEIRDFLEMHYSG